MGIEEQVAKQNQQALVPHEWQVFEQALSKPFFLIQQHQQSIKSTPKITKGQ